MLIGAPISSDRSHTNTTALHLGEQVIQRIWCSPGALRGGSFQIRAAICTRSPIRVFNIDRLPSRSAAKRFSSRVAIHINVSTSSQYLLRSGSIAICPYLNLVYPRKSYTRSMNVTTASGYPDSAGSEVSGSRPRVTGYAFRKPGCEKVAPAGQFQVAGGNSCTLPG